MIPATIEVSTSVMYFCICLQEENNRLFFGLLKYMHIRAHKHIYCMYPKPILFRLTLGKKGAIFVFI